MQAFPLDARGPGDFGEAPAAASVIRRNAISSTFGSSVSSNAALRYSAAIPDCPSVFSSSPCRAKRLGVVHGWVLRFLKSFK